MKDHWTEYEQDWQQHIANMQDSTEHINYLTNSNECFFEFCEQKDQEIENKINEMWRVN